MVPRWCGRGVEAGTTQVLISSEGWVFLSQLPCERWYRTCSSEWEGNLGLPRKVLNTQKSGCHEVSGKASHLEWGNGGHTLQGCPDWPACLQCCGHGCGPLQAQAQTAPAPPAERGHPWPVISLTAHWPSCMGPPAPRGQDPIPGCAVAPAFRTALAQVGIPGMCGLWGSSVTQRLDEAGGLTGTRMMMTMMMKGQR